MHHIGTCITYIHMHYVSTYKIYQYASQSPMHNPCMISMYHIYIHQASTCITWWIYIYILIILYVHHIYTSHASPHHLNASHFHIHHLTTIDITLTRPGASPPRWIIPVTHIMSLHASLLSHASHLPRHASPPCSFRCGMALADLTRHLPAVLLCRSPFIADGLCHSVLCYITVHYHRPISPRIIAVIYWAVSQRCAHCRWRIAIPHNGRSLYVYTVNSEASLTDHLHRPTTSLCWSL